jgi:hypothetical protein
VNQRDLGGDVGQVKRLFHGGIAAADHGDLLAAIEKAIAGGTGADALAHESLLGGQTQVLGGGAGGDNQGVAGIGIGTHQLERALVQVRLVDMVENNFGIKPLGVLLHLDHQVGTLEIVGATRPVFHFGGGGQLAALLHAGDNDGFEVGAGGIDGSRVACGAGAENNQFVMLGVTHNGDVLWTGLGWAFVSGGNDK